MDASFWASVLVGIAVYICGVVFVTYFFEQRGYGREQLWEKYVGTPLWIKFHGDSAFTNNWQRILKEDFLSFLAWVHLFIAMIVSAVAGLLAQAYVAWRKADDL